MLFNQGSRFIGSGTPTDRTREFQYHRRKLEIRFVLTIISFCLVPTALYHNARMLYRDVDTIISSGISMEKSKGTLRRELREQASVVNYPRALVGIFSRDDATGAMQRQQYRTMFEPMSSSDPRICSLPQFMEKVNNPHQQLHHDDCLLVYTFVIGAYKSHDTSKPAEIVENFVVTPMDESIPKPLEFVVDKVVHPYSEDVNLPDVTRLNIRENDHDGKSQTFLNFAYRHVLGMGENNARHVPIEYCIKLGPDTFLSLHRYFHFAQTELLPAPFHRGILGGMVRDKAYYERSAPQIVDPQYERDVLPRLESFWGKEFEGIHLYMSRELYILSCDLVEFVLKEVPFSRHRVAAGGYVTGEEDHDISSMAFHSPTPLHIILIGKSQRFWRHPVNTKDDWEALVAVERAARSEPS